MDATPRMKKARPSFDVAREKLDEHRDAWVYRSDVPPPPVPHAVLPAEPSGAAPVPAADATAEGSPRPGGGWIEAGIVGVLTIPLTVTALACIAPAIWICGARARR